MEISSSGATGFVALATIWAIFTTVFWMIVGWRAMRAHERLAESTAAMAHGTERGGHVRE